VKQRVSDRGVLLAKLAIDQKSVTIEMLTFRMKSYTAKLGHFSKDFG
jgi:hypothetical protein